MKDPSWSEIKTDHGVLCFYRIHFTENNGKTIVTLTGEPVQASAGEIEGFLSINSSMTEGFGKTFDQLSKYLDKNK